MAAFKLGETARSVRMLAKEAETPRLQQLLTASSSALKERVQELRVAVEELNREALTLPVTQPRKRATARVRAQGQSFVLAGRKSLTPNGGSTNGRLRLGRPT